MKITQFESLPPFIEIPVDVEGDVHAAKAWRETVETSAAVLARFEDGAPAWIGNGKVDYLATWPGEALLEHVLTTLAEQCGLDIVKTGPDVRLRRAGALQFAFNYGPDPVDLYPLGAPQASEAYVLGGPHLEPSGVSAWSVSRA